MFVYAFQNNEREKLRERKLTNKQKAPTFLLAAREDIDNAGHRPRVAGERFYVVCNAAMRGRLIVF